MGPVVRISKGRFEPEMFAEVKRLVEASAATLRPAINELRGLIYYHVGVDKETCTLVNVSIWTDLAAAKRMETLAPMLAQRPMLEKTGVVFDRIANYEPLWTIGSVDNTSKEE